jgi:Bacterial regulatory proteins, gntR family
MHSATVGGPVDLLVTLDGSENLGEQVYRKIRDAIVEGRVPAGVMLPSTRDMAARLSVSRTTIAKAYERLSAEGFIRSRSGRGSYVDDRTGWGGVVHYVALETAPAGTDLRILAGWDAVAPFSLAFSVLPRLFFVGALVLGLRASGAARWLTRSGALVMVLSLVGSATLLTGVLFPVLALGTLGYELWVGALAWHWLRDRSSAGTGEAASLSR